MNQYVRKDNDINSSYYNSSQTLDERTKSIKDKLEKKKIITNTAVMLGLLTMVGLLLSKNMVLLLEHKMPFEIDFVQLAPSEIFASCFKVSVFFALYFSLPFTLFSLGKKYSAKLNDIDSKYLVKLIAIGFGLFTAGILAAYYFFIPSSLFFFMGFNSSLAKVGISISSYTSYCLQTILFTGCMFELPVIYDFIKKTNCVTTKMLLTYWKPVLIASTIFSYILTSPDVFTQLFVVVGAFLVYSSCIFAAKIVEAN